MCRLATCKNHRQFCFQLLLVSAERFLKIYELWKLQNRENWIMYIQNKTRDHSLENMFMMTNCLQIKWHFVNREIFSALKDYGAEPNEMFSRLSDPLEFG